jgi:hypothetical protein
MKNIPKQNKKILTGGALVLAATASVFAQQQPFMQAGTAQPPLLPSPPTVAAAAATTGGTNAAVVGDPNSCATYGGCFAGNAPVSDEVAFDYRAEFAWQTDYGDSTLRYSADYYNLEGGVNVKPFAFGAGYEDLGSGANTGAGGGRAGFRTPLATLHPFNGWDNVFLTTPANGLRDLYGYAQVTLPAQVPLRFVYHKFDADYGSGNYGQEFDLIASKKFGKYWTATLEYSSYQGQDAAPGSSLATVANVDVQKFWAQIEFNF